jgi:hypothetical protein
VALTVELSNQALSALEGLSAQGREYVMRSLQGALSLGVGQEHLHAGGMCLTLQREGTSGVTVTAASPVCLLSVDDG